MNAIQKLLTDNIDIWTAADTEKKSGRGRSSGNAASVYGIKKLRELILELAVRGKLVPQDPSDEPASELIERVKNEKRLLEKQGKARKQRALTNVADDDVPFMVPNTWVWAQLEDIGHDWGQKIPIDDFSYIDVGSVNNVRGVVNQAVVLAASEAPSRARKIVKPGTIIYSTIRPYLQNIAVIENDITPEPIASTAFAIIQPLANMLPRYFLHYLRSPAFVSYVESVQTGIAYPAINDKQFFSGFVPIPPLAEQHRIVAKVDELMALCDQLETQHNNAADAHEKLVSQLLGTLTESQSAADFSDNWQRIAAHFDTLFTTEASIDALKQTLLQLAVMGRLVEQNAGDVSAICYLASHNIKATSARVPGWAAAELGVLGTILGGATPSKNNAEYWTGSIPWVSPKDMKIDFISTSQDQISEAAIENTSLRLVPSHSLLMVVRGMILAHSFPVALTLVPVTINQDMKALIPPPELASYLLLFLKAHKATVAKLVDRSTHGTCKLKSEKLWALPIHLPPLSEQTRILHRVGELMALCDQLKERLSEASKTRCQLTEALVKGGAALMDYSRPCGSL